MRKYETVFISDPDLSEQSRTDLFEKVRNIITKENGLVLNFDEWGNKKLAYEIKKKLRGHYVCLTYGGTGDLVKELERNFRLSDNILKFMTILLSDDVTAEELEQEAQQAQAETQPEAQETDENTADTDGDEAESSEGDSEKAEATQEDQN